MNKFTKISATALFALFLTACDKPADKAPAAKAEAPAATQTQQPAEAAKPAEQAQAAAPAQQAPAVKVEPLSAEEAADYAKVIEWNKTQQPAQQVAQQKLQDELNAAVQAKDNAKITAAIEGFNKTLQETIKNLDGLDVKSDLVKGVKAKTKEVLTLSSSLLVEQAKLATASQPSEADLKTYQDKANVLQNALEELKKASAELEVRAAQK